MEDTPLGEDDLLIVERAVKKMKSQAGMHHIALDNRNFFGSRQNLPTRIFEEKSAMHWFLFALGCDRIGESREGNRECESENQEASPPGEGTKDHEGLTTPVWRAN